MSHWTFASSPMLILMAVIMGGLALWFSWRICTANARSRQILGLEAFRVLIIVLLLVIAFIGILLRLRLHF